MTLESRLSHDADVSMLALRPDDVTSLRSPPLTPLTMTTLGASPALATLDGDVTNRAGDVGKCECWQDASAGGCDVVDGETGVCVASVTSSRVSAAPFVVSDASASPEASTVDGLADVTALWSLTSLAFDEFVLKFKSAAFVAAPLLTSELVTSGVVAGAGESHARRDVGVSADDVIAARSKRSLTFFTYTLLGLPGVYASVTLSPARVTSSGDATPFAVFGDCLVRDDV